ncbi:MAG: site-specific integrase [Micrococcales bacterium]|nr:site-specific integrase [Micrococcales bacterium]
MTRSGGQSAGRRSFGYIRPLSSGRFQASYQGPDGQRRLADLPFETRKAADDWLSEQRIAIDAGTWRSPDRADEPFGDYAVRWLGSRTDLKASTVSLYKRLLSCHLLPTLADVVLKDFTPEIIGSWQAHLEGTTGATARAQAYRLARTIFNAAVGEGVIKVNPCVVVGGGVTSARSRTPATVGEVEVIAEAMPDRYRFLIRMAAWSGLSRGELFDLRRGSFLALGGSAVVTVSSVAVSVDDTYVVDRPTSVVGSRTVHLPKHLIEPLEEHLAEFVGKDDDALVFCTRTGKRVTSSHLSKVFAQAARQAGRGDLRFRDLRDTGASLAARGGATTEELMNRLGHTSSRAARAYRRSVDQRDKAIAETLDAAYLAGRDTSDAPNQPGDQP